MILVSTLPITRSRLFSEVMLRISSCRHAQTNTDRQLRSESPGRHKHGVEDGGFGDISSAPHTVVVKIIHTLVDFGYLLLLW